jgi:hypothetical protein
VEVDLFGQRQSEPGAQEVDGHPSAAEAKGQPGDVILIILKEIHKHRHYHYPPKFVGKRRWMSDAYEMEEVRRIHQEKLRQYGVR